MTNRLTTVATLAAGIAIGIAATPALRAQAPAAAAPVYYVVEVDVTDEEGYIKQYAPKIRASVAAAGGRQLANTAQAVAVEGAAPAKRVVILAWDSVEKIKAWRDSDDFKAARVEGDKVAKFRSFAVPALAP